MALKRRIQQPSGYDITAGRAEQVKQFNKDLRFIQGFTKGIVNGNNNYQIKLNAPGKFLLGISVIPSDGNTVSLANSTIDFTVNNNNLLVKVATPQAIPNYVQGMMFLPTPQPLDGNDTITLNLQQNASPAPAISAVIQIFYVPRI